MTDTLTIYWTDGYENVYKISTEDEVKFEELYINIQRKSGECIFIPMNNIRHFHTNAPVKNKVIDKV